VWSWDITKLLGPVKWTWYYLYARHEALRDREEVQDLLRHAVAVAW
jgi:hypothetical protein